MREPTLSVRLAHQSPVLIVLLITALTVAGCVTNSGSGWGPPPRSDLSNQIREVDLGPRGPRQQASVSATEEPGKAVVYQGDGSSATANAATASRTRNLQADLLTTGALPDAGNATAGKGYEMNFENTPIATVAKAVLSDILGFGYTIDPRVQGSISLSSGRPIPRNDLLYVFESALRVSNVALVRTRRAIVWFLRPKRLALGRLTGGGNLRPALASPSFPCSTFQLRR
jgi:general secretion pathway protein D